jgi:acetyl-CoA acetyltransferase
MYVCKYVSMYVFKYVHMYTRMYGGAVAIGHPFGMTGARQVSIYVNV